MVPYCTVCTTVDETCAYRLVWKLVAIVTGVGPPIDIWVLLQEILAIPLVGSAMPLLTWTVWFVGDLVPDVNICLPSDDTCIPCASAVTITVVHVLDAL